MKRFRISAKRAGDIQYVVCRCLDSIETADEKLYIFYTATGLKVETKQPPFRKQHYRVAQGKLTDCEYDTAADCWVEKELSLGTRADWSPDHTPVCVLV